MQCKLENLKESQRETARSLHNQGVLYIYQSLTDYCMPKKRKREKGKKKRRKNLEHGSFFTKNALKEFFPLLSKLEVL